MADTDRTSQRPFIIRRPGRLLLACALLGALLLQAAGAAVLPDSVSEILQERAAAFVQAPGFAEADPEVLQEQLHADERLWSDAAAGSVFLPDADLDPLAKAVLLVESQEAPLQHYRYLLTYLLRSPAPDYPEAAHSYVEVTRFNLGPARHADAVSAYGENAAPLEEFGSGPDVSWRFVFHSVMGQRSDVFAASRLELEPGEAAGQDCLGEPCLSLAEPVLPAGEFPNADAPAFDESPLYVARAYEGGVALPVRVAAEMFSAVTGHGFEAAEGDSAEPQLTLAISHNVGGQDENSFALLRQGRLLDDAISEIWWQRREVSGADLETWNLVDWQQVTVPRLR